MAIKKYFATADNTISNAFDETLLSSNKATGSNMGAADILEVFQVYGQQATSSSELSRILIQFDTTAIASDRTDLKIPASGSVKFYLNMYNAAHSSTLPENFDLTISAVSQSWQEGNGLDMVNYTDKTYEGTGSNWIQARHSASTDNGRWTSTGGDYFTDSSSSFSQNFPEGYENLEKDVTTLVEQWLDSGGNVLGSKNNYGFGVKLSDNLEAATKSYYTKKFFARGSEFFFKRPTIEARWDASTKDDRGNFFASSSLAPANDNLNVLYLYNRIRGRLRNIPAVGTDDIEVSLYTEAGGSQIGTTFTGSYVSAGVYKCSVYADTTDTSIIDVWHSASVQYHTGSIAVKSQKAQVLDEDGRYLVTIPNLNTNYYKSDIARFKLYVRPKKWSPTVYTVSQATPENTIIPSASYEVFRIIDDLVVIQHDTGSNQTTMMSHNVSGNYFDLDMSSLETGYDYGIRFAFYDDYLANWNHQPYEFRFKVREDEY